METAKETDVSNTKPFLASAFLAAALLATSTGNADAARPDTRAYTCGEVQSALRQQGSIIFTYGPNLYARFVAGVGYCGPQQQTQLKTVPTLDNPRCRIGYVCRESID